LKFKKKAAPRVVDIVRPKTNQPIIEEPLMKKSLIPKTTTAKQKESFKTNLPVSMDEMDTRIALIQALIPLGLKAVEETLQHEISDLAGERYSRGMGQNHYNRWGSQRGSVYLADQKIPIEVPRIRDTWLAMRSV
jgi:hypothetical protein